MLVWRRLSSLRPGERGAGWKARATRINQFAVTVAIALRAVPHEPVTTT
jgi:hypothetical protein